MFGTLGEGVRKSIDQLGVIKELNALVILAGEPAPGRTALRLNIDSS